MVSGTCRPVARVVGTFGVGASLPNSRIFLNPCTLRTLLSSVRMYCRTCRSRPVIGFCSPTATRTFGATQQSSTPRRVGCPRGGERRHRALVVQRGQARLLGRLSRAPELAASAPRSCAPVPEWPTTPENLFGAG